MAVLWDLVGRERWSESLARAEQCSLQQDWSYGEAIRDQGHEVCRAVLEIDGDLVALAQIARRHFFGPLSLALLMRGPVWIGHRDDAREAALLRAISQHVRGSAVMWMPDAPCNEDRPAARRCGFHRFLTGYSTVFIDLRQGADKVLRQANGKWRNRVRAGERAALEVVEQPRRELIEWLVDANELYRRKIGYSGPTPAFSRSLGKNAEPDQRIVLVALNGGAPVAGIALHIHGRCATYYMACTSPRGRELQAHHLLLWRGIQRLCELGIRGFDLGGIDTQRAPGLARFKLGTGGRADTLPGTYLVPPTFKSSAHNARGPRFPAALHALKRQVGRT